MMIKLILVLVFSTSLVYCSVDRLKELFEVTNRVERTLEHFCKQEIFNRELETKLKIDVEQLQTDSSERSQIIEQVRETSQRNFYGILRLSEQLEEIKKQTIEADEKSSSEEVKRLKNEVTELKKAFNILKNENLKGNQEFSKKLELYETENVRTNQEFTRKLELFEAENVELKKEIKELKLELKESGNSEAIENLSDRVSKAEKTAEKVDENTRKISNIKAEFRGMKPAVTEFVFKIENYGSLKKLDKAIHSDSFLVGRGNYGYTFRLKVHLNGWGEDINTHVGVAYQILQSDIDDILVWPFLGTIKIAILAQTNGKGYIEYTNEVDKDYANLRLRNYMKPGTITHYFFPDNFPAGHSSAFPVATVEEPPYLVNDTMYIKMTFSDLKLLE